MTRGHADVVVVAAGSSERFGSDKLEAIVGDRPLLAWTIDRLASSAQVERIVVVTSAGRIERVRNAPWLSPKVVEVLVGGARRQDSVAAGIEAIGRLVSVAPDEAVDRVVLVHDGARPVVTAGLVEAVIEAVRIHGAAVPVVSIAETVKRVGADGRILETIDRAGLASAQTPQGATLGAFRRALREQAREGSREYTDEAALLEACNITVHAIPGEPTNLKVTMPADLARVEALLGARSLDGAAGQGIPAPSRVGYGSDSHPIGPAMGLALGGVVIEQAPRLHGHSDGDVVLHAVADALLGAAGLGDLGRIFPAGPATPAGIVSTELVAEVLRRVTAAGFAVASLDCTIVAGRPRLAARLPTIAARIAELLSIDASAVNVKASTGNLDGMEGAGRGMSATVIVILTTRSAGQ